MIIPYQGIGAFHLYSSEETIKKQLQLEEESFVEEEWSNDGNESVPWRIIRTASKMNFFFANDKLFKIYVEEGFDGSLESGVSIGMPMDKAIRLDPELKYNDWEEDWNSPKGYWIEDELDNNTVATITVFIKEILDDELFYKYEW
jgi:hypothetical protein